MYNVANHIARELMKALDIFDTQNVFFSKQNYLMQRFSSAKLFLYNNSRKRKAYISSLGRYVFGSEISYNKAPPRLPGLGC